MPALLADVVGALSGHGSPGETAPDNRCGMRIVSICPSNTEIACLLGLGADLVGLDRASDWPPEVQHLPRVGPDLDVDVDAIEALRPDLVLSSSSVPGMEKNLERLDARGLAHLVVDAESIGGVWESIRVVGRVVGRGARAEAVVGELQARLDAVERRSAELPRRARVFLEWWPKPVIVPGARCWSTEMIRVAGGENVFGDRDVRSVPIPDDEVVAAAPDLLLTCWCGVPHDKQKPARMAARAGWEGIPGVVSGRMYAAEEPHFARPGPRLVEGVEWLHERIREWAAC